MDKQTLVKNARRLRIGRCFAYIDILIFSAFYFDGTHYIISPLLNAIGRERNVSPSTHL